MKGEGRRTGEKKKRDKDVKMVKSQKNKEGDGGGKEDEQKEKFSVLCVNFKCKTLKIRVRLCQLLAKYVEPGKNWKQGRTT